MANDQQTQHLSFLSLEEVEGILATALASGDWCEQTRIAVYLMDSAIPPDLDAGTMDENSFELEEIYIEFLTEGGSVPETAAAIFALIP